MPTLVLSQRYSLDSDAMWRAALHAGWDVERVRGFALDPGLAERDPVLYAETLFADAAMEPLGIALLQPTEGWLPALPEAHRCRSIRLVTLEEARALGEARFVKAPDEKWFPAKVYAPGELAETTPGGSDGRAHEKGTAAQRVSSRHPSAAAVDAIVTGTPTRA
ncbi:MAG TPA: hypothetical protein VLS89_18570 [Candidatus Nanopelagicales bacterium]|nr:hypothetical protein [Candidatus Nanopelagicales bacterium]